MLADLRTEIAKGHVLAIVGAGVSIGATNNAPVASWLGLLESGVARCVEVARPLPPRWAERVREEIASGDLDDLLSAAEKVSAKLGAPKGGEYRRWLRETVGALELKDRSALEALRDLGIPLATTNYDGLLEEVTGQPPVSWHEGAKVERVIRGDEPGILHLHGYWAEPESVVLGIRSYEQIVGDAHAQNVQRALRTTRTLLFVGCGAGLSDPNFGALLRWSRQIFAEDEYRHFRLCRETEVAPLQNEHAPEERIFPLPFGPDHRDLPGFLRSLKQAAGVKPTSRPAGISTGQIPRLPAAPRCFGRDDEVRNLVDSLCADPPPPVPVLGPPGIGKTTVTLAALHDSRIVERFGNRRYFVRCDSATSRDGLMREIARWMQLETGPHLEAQVFAELERGPVVLALDNAETPWWADTIATEDLLSQLCGIPGLALVASIRGEQRPLGPAWREATRVGPLDLAAARTAFLAVAGERFSGDPDLDRLLEAVDRVALAVTLLAHQAEVESDLSPLWKRWQDKRTELLRRADGKERLTNIEVSLELSIASLRMTENARRLLSLLGMLPNGIARKDLDKLFPESDEAAAVLRQVGLALAQEQRLRVLAPVREYVHSHYSPGWEDQFRLVTHYVELAQTAEQVGGEGGAEVVKRLSSELGNVDTMVLIGLDSSDPKPAIQAATALAELMRFTGLGVPSVLERAREVAKSTYSLLEANCTKSLGDIALGRSDHGAALRCYEEALPLYKRFGNLRGEASCILRLGDIALLHSDHDAALRHYEEALPLFRRIGDLRGDANCILRLGDIALRRSDHEAARRRYEEALPLFRPVGDLLGEANCIQRLGGIALRRSDHDAARLRFEEALPLCRRVGDLLGEANCIQSLGDIALRHSDHDTAHRCYDEAVFLFRRVGSLLGEANCIRSLGDIALRRSDRDAACRRYEEALPLFRRVGDLLGEANCILSLGDIALERSDQNAARQRYEEALPIYRRVGDWLGEANCILSLGDIALRRSDHDIARQRYEEAIPIFEHVGDPLGKANCIRGLGDIDLQRSAQDAARVKFEEAQGLYKRIPEPYSIGWTHVRLARIALANETRNQHVEAARAAWESIKRPDLVDELRQEFSDLFPDPSSPGPALQ